MHAKQYLRAATAKQLTRMEEAPRNKSALHVWRQSYCMHTYIYMYSLILRLVKSMANNPVRSCSLTRERCAIGILTGHHKRLNCSRTTDGLKAPLKNTTTLIAHSMRRRDYRIFYSYHSNDASYYMYVHAAI